MKKILGLLLMMLITINIYAVATSEVGDPTTYLTAEQLTKYNEDLRIATIKQEADLQIANLENKIKTYGEWVGVGGEVGIAVKEGLSAVVDVADKFGGTKVGEFTMLMIGWKVMGEDVIRILLGLLFILSYILILTPLFRRLVRTRKIKIKDEGWFKYPKEYKIIEPTVDGDEVVWLTIVFIVGLFISIWITYSIMFN